LETGSGKFRICRYSQKALVKWLLIVGLMAPVWVSAQISPGPLSRAHQEWDGPVSCTTCHTFGLSGRRLKCLECHTEIRQRLDQKRGYHARVADTAKGDLDCARCHTEHNGRDFQLTAPDTFTKSFDHRQAGYPLEARHGELTCADCHNGRRIPAAARSSIKVKDPNRTFLGLSPQCLNCHEDEHRGQLGPDCASCHNFRSWSEVSGFDHARTRFPLTGLHQKTQCEQCHKPEQPYRGIAFASCQDCHRDPHRGAFEVTASAAGCARCHTTAGWRIVRPGSGFDHSKTEFPLRGKHATVTCLDCHKSSNFSQPVAYARCMDCHKDSHTGQFAYRADKGDCGACHDERAFKPATYTRQQHQKSRYPLIGRHAAVECANCHKPEGVKTIYRVAFDRCLRCHKDNHEGQFAAAPYLNQCEPCHNEQGFRPSSFSLTRHAKTRFPLEGAHGAVICVDCHKSAPGRPAAAARFRIESRACAACHPDPHQTKALRLASLRSECGQCHDTVAWESTAAFDHGITGFRLQGAHRTVDCVGCHSAAPSKERNLLFHQAKTSCSGCHADVHGGQFGTPETVDCASCHSQTSFRPSSYDHNLSVFKLTGGHRGVACAACHIKKRDADGREVAIYKGTSVKCADCHADAARLGPTP
jgi:predicted CXXCH cytochrome family protein